MSEEQQRRGRPVGRYSVGLPERLCRRLVAADRAVSLVRSVADRMGHQDLRGHAERALAEIVAMRGILSGLPRWWRPR
jgi:predicted ArsR family transcriptional regulator